MCVGKGGINRPYQVNSGVLEVCPRQQELRKLTSVLRGAVASKLNTN